MKTITELEEKFNADKNMIVRLYIDLIKLTEADSWKVRAKIVDDLMDALKPYVLIKVSGKEEHAKNI